MRDMGIPASHPNTYYLQPTCISDDGTTAFGQLTEFNGWVGFRYNTTTGFQDLGGIVPSACTADGTEAVGIESMYFPAVWSVGNGGGYLDHLLSANGTTQALGTISGPVTISPDGSAITALGPDVYLTDQTWFGIWQISRERHHLWRAVECDAATQRLARDHGHRRQFRHATWAPL